MAMKIPNIKVNQYQTTKRPVKKILFIMFLTLLIDLFAFTVILPIFPAMIGYYETKEANLEGTVLSHFQATATYLKSTFLPSTNTNPHITTTLLGGFIGSWYSLLQFAVSPYIGKLADKYGRKPILVTSVMFNLISNLIWVVAGDFKVFLLARTVAGLSEGNVQLASAIVADVTDKQGRAKGMALIGIAFSIAFTIGPALSGYCISNQLIPDLSSLIGTTSHPFSSVALLASLLIVIELVLILLFLDETKGYQSPDSTNLTSEPKPTNQISQSQTLKTIQHAYYTHFLYLFVFSGMEFTLPFLGYSHFRFGHDDQGRMFGILGITSALLQGGYVRRFSFKLGEPAIIKQGLVSCFIALTLIPLLALPTNSLPYLYLAILFLAFTSATVSSSLSSHTSLKAEPLAPYYPDKDFRAEIMGRFRSYGQLGRVMGPIAACSLYWGFGPTTCYYTGALATLVVLAYFKTQTPKNEVKKD